LRRLDMNRNLVRAFFSLLPVLAFLASGAFAATSGYKGYPRGNALTTVQELKGLIDARDPKLVILAAQSNLEYLSSWIGWSKDDRLPMEAGLSHEDAPALAGDARRRR
jgi:hypothetical protein